MKNHFTTFISFWQNFPFNPGLPGPGLRLIDLRNVSFVLLCMYNFLFGHIVLSSIIYPLYIRFEGHHHLSKWWSKASQPHACRQAFGLARKDLEWAHVKFCFCFCFYWRLKLLTSRITRILIVQVRTFTPPNSDFIAFHRLIAFNIKYLSVFRV